MFLSVVIPSYNEANRIGKTFIAIYSYLSTKDFDYEIIIVDDGSVDDTRKIIQSFADKFNNFKILGDGINHGKGWAVRQGMSVAKGDYCLFVDADNSIPIEEFDKFIFEIKKNDYSILIGSKHLTKSKIIKNQLPHRVFFGKIGNRFIQIITGLKIKDTQCGFKCFSSRAKLVFEQSKIDGFAFDVEVLLRAKKSGFKIKEIPVSLISNNFSKVSFLDYLKVLVDVIKIKKIVG